MTLRRTPLKRRKRERFGIRPVKFRSEPFKQFVRGFPCILDGKPGHTCEGKIQFAHVRLGTDGGTGLKPSDYYGVPACFNAHILTEHQHGGPALQRQFGIDLKAEAERYWKEWPDHYEVERKIKEGLIL